ncbi:MAG: hypothetical protein N3D82_05765 [Ignisphaera sp.]|nr:hypothetical protein [Ignisphaera sp.]MCX8168512.1 hypothetical protein [Ignisphaera sp.]MDW8085048.1 hypothetical protein [Ignisphaera sp.]
MGAKSVALLVVGILLFVTGWIVLLNGIEVKTCSSTLYVPREFEGELRLSYTEWIYWTNVPLNVSDFYVRENVTKTFEFTVNKSIGWLNLVIIGEPVKENYKGSLIIANASDPSQTVVSLSLHPMQSIGGRGMNITSMFLQSLQPGTYLLSITLDTNAYIRRISIAGPSATETEKLTPKIKFTPSTYDQIYLSYTCGITFSNAIIAAIVMTVGMAMTVASTIAMQLREKLHVKADIRRLKKFRKT